MTLAKNTTFGPNGKFANFKLVTIICEPVLLASILSLAKKNGTTGYTVTDVSGEGSGEKRSGEVPAAKSKVELILEPTMASELMNEIGQRYFENYALITYSADISVLRPEKFEI